MRFLHVPELRPQTKVALLLAVFAVTAMLYLAQDILMPFALAVLISFLLTPIVVKLESWRVGRTLSVVATAFIAFLMLGLALFVMAAQLLDLAESLPGYKENLKAKASSFRGSGDGPFQRIADTFHELSVEFSEPKIAETANPDAARPKPASPEAEAAPEEAPVPVAVVDTKTSPFEIVRMVSASVLGPLGTAAIVVVIVIFMLIERRDLRDRFIHLVGRGQLRITTQAIDEAAERVSRYLMAQLIVNVSYGIPVGLGLWFIGIPNAALWGILAAMLRFVPYIGPWIAAIFPITLSFAITPVWGPLFATVGLFVFMELISNNVVEPWLYGASTGLSSTAVIVSAVFWTWLWGAGGLLLATPLTVCFAVMGKYVPSLSFLDVILGDHPPIAPEHRFYQRLLAGDETELFETVEKYEDKNELGTLFDEIIVPALRQAERDFSIGEITREERTELLDRVQESLQSLDGWKSEREDDDIDARVTIVPARGEGDYVCALMLAHLLAASGVNALVTSHQTLNSEVAQHLRADKDCWLCLSVLHSTTARSGETHIRRLRGSTENSILGLWGTEAHGTQSTGVEIARSLREGARNLRERLPVTLPETPAAPQPEPA